MSVPFTCEDVPAEMIPFYRHFPSRTTAETFAVAERLSTLPAGHALKIAHASARLHATLRQARRNKWLARYRVWKGVDCLLIIPDERCEPRP